MIKALFAGSFDPITNGHIDILQQASEIFDEVVVAIGINPKKKSLLPLDTRIKLIKEALCGFKNVEVSSYDELTVDYAAKIGAKVLIRGIRNEADYSYEREIAFFNNKLDNSIQTVFLMPKPENIFISSSAVRELILNKSDVSDFVPLNVSNFLKTM